MASNRAKKRNGRPKLPPEDQRNHVVSFRVSPRELADVSPRAIAAGHVNINEYARHVFLNQQLVVLQETETIANPLVISTLNRLGNNLNQIVRQKNAGLGDLPYEEAKELLERIDAIIKRELEP